MSVYAGNIARRHRLNGSLLIPLALSLILLGGSLGLAWLAIDPQFLRYAVTAAVVPLVVGIGLTAPRKTLLALMIWLAALGFVRRIVSGYAPASGNDPLLLVEPAILGVLLVTAATRGAFRRRTSLSNAVAVLSLLVLLGAVNPLQGSLVAGVAGLLFVLVPMLGFWVGRGLCDDETLSKMLKLIGALALVAAGYGLWQTFVDFPWWDFNWAWDAYEHGYRALWVFSSVSRGEIRPFGMFSSASEYVAYIAIGIVIWTSLGMTRRRQLVALAAAALLGVALVYGSSRGIVVGLLAGMLLMLGARRRQQITVSLSLGAAVLLLVPAVAGLVPVAAGHSALLTHLVEGLRDPLDPNASTAVGHAQLVVDGITSAVHDPIGLGVSAVSIAGARFGGIQRQTEADPSNVAVGLGLPGLLAYVAVLFVGIRRAYRVALLRRDRLSLAALGILATTLFQWLNGGNYAVAIIPWLILGWLDRPTVLGRAGARKGGGRRRGRLPDSALASPG